jgi:hypothetical protein
MQNDQCWERTRPCEHAQRTRNNILQNVGTGVERRNHLRYLGMTPIAGCFDCADSSGEAVWGVQCFWVEHADIKYVLRRMAVRWHGAGARLRAAATLY